MGLPEHLAGWGEIAASSNSGKNSILRLGRIFELQHFCRALYARHAGALHQAAVHLEQALASFLNVGVDTIHKDLGFVASRLGNDWMKQRNPLIGCIEVPAA